MTSIKNSAEKNILEYKNLLEKNNFSVDEPKLNNYCFEINIFDESDKLKLLVYFGKRGVKTVLQGNKETELYDKVSSIIFGKTLFSNFKEELIEPEAYIGTDESGKGDYFGPLVIAGVFVDRQSILKLKEIGVKDSKKILDKDIKIISVKIKKIIGSQFNIISISPKTYNDLHKKMVNINKILGWAHAKVLENILINNEADEAISDKFGDESLINNALQEKGKKLKLHQVIKAERYTAVAAASILARNKFNEWFEIQNNKLKITIPKGASDLVNKAAIKIKNEYGDEFIKDLVKLHFKNSKKY